MLEPTPFLTQVKNAEHDPLRVLVVGAGIAGVTAAQLLRRDGHHPVLIERAKDDSHDGYMLALMPIVDAAIADLGVTDEYRASGEPFARYALHSRKGELRRVDNIGALLAADGDYLGIGREELMRVLTSSGCPVTFNSTVVALNETPDAVAATIRSGTIEHEARFDLVIVADGIRSTTRELVLAGRPVQLVDTRWGGWVVWSPVDDDPARGDELWGAGFFVGAYPVKGRLGVFLGGPAEDLRGGKAEFVASVRSRLTTIPPRIEAALTAVSEHPEPFYWPLDDCRSPQWTTKRTVLLGDAAAGFLPTAGVGAGMAIESAWVLTRLLRRVDAHSLASVLSAYEATERPRVEAAQNNSRTLAKLMFSRSRILAWLRDTVMRFMSIDATIAPIARLIREAPDPDAVKIPH